MKIFACPSCGGELVFHSPVSVYAVCGYCKSMVVRQDIKLENIGKIAELRDDMSPLQIGTTGKFQNASFTLVGRAKYGWSDGTWNEWFMLTDAVTRGWLGEAQGIYMISHEIDPVNSRRSLENLALSKKVRLGHSVEIAGRNFLVSDVKSCTCIGSEGELPFRAQPGVELKSIDLVGEDRGFASIELGGDDLRVYVGQYCDFREFDFGNLRPVLGWDPKVAVSSVAPAPSLS